MTATRRPAEADKAPAPCRVSRPGSVSSAARQAAALQRPTLRPRRGGQPQPGLVATAGQPGRGGKQSLELRELPPWAAARPTPGQRIAKDCRGRSHPPGAAWQRTLAASPAQIRRHLRGLLACQFSDARFRKCGIFLELFGGTGKVAKAWRALGFAALSLDVLNGPMEDHLARAFEDVIVGWIRGGVVLGFVLGTPRTTWTRALRRPLRDAAEPMGKSHLNDSELARLKVGNATFHFSCRIIARCRALGIPVLLENPQTSLLWTAPRFLSLTSHNDARRSDCHMCQYGTRWRKATRVQGWNVCSLEALSCKCRGKNGICSRSKLPHIELSGTAPGGRKWTSLAAAYPPAFAAAAAAVLVFSSEHIHGGKLAQVMCV